MTITMSDAPDPYRECHHGVARQPGFVGLVLYDDVYQEAHTVDP